MKLSGILFIIGGIAFVTGGCNNEQTVKGSTNDSGSASAGTYAYDREFLNQHNQSTIELSNPDGGKVLLAAGYQARVMTSTASGDSGKSFGWLNYNLIAAPQKKTNFNPVGGEERFWLGPEGGQYALYFHPKDSFSISKWQVPAVIDTLGYDVKTSSATSAVFSKKATLTNYTGTVFSIDIDRSINLLAKNTIEQKLNTSLPADVHFVGYETLNKITNTGADDWKKEKGLISIWLLGMFTPTPETVVIIPFHPQPDARSLITDSYFGAMPPGRLIVKDSVLFFICDGKYRSKIGLSPLIAKPVAGSFDFKNNVLTILLPTVEKNGMYVNSKWELQKEPFKGDVINAYNDGPLADGSQMGPFYEIESSSSVKELKKGESLGYQQTTIHIEGSYAALKVIAKAVLQVDLDEARSSH